MATSKVQVFKYGKPSKGVKVVLEFTGLHNMGFTNSFYTNSDGNAHIDHSSTGPAKVYLDGRCVGSMNTPGFEVFYL